MKTFYWLCCSFSIYKVHILHSKTFSNCTFRISFGAPPISFCLCRCLSPSLSLCLSLTLSVCLSICLLLTSVHVFLSLNFLLRCFDPCLLALTRVSLHVHVFLSEYISFSICLSVCLPLSASSASLCVSLWLYLSLSLFVAILSHSLSLYFCRSVRLYVSLLLSPPIRFSPCIYPYIHKQFKHILFRFRTGNKYGEPLTKLFL